METGSDAAPRERARGLAHRLRTYWSGRPAGPGGEQSNSGDYLPFKYDPVDEELEAHRSPLALLAWASLAVFGLALAAYVIPHRDEWKPTAGLQVVEGSVRGPKGFSAAPTSRLPELRSAPPLAEIVPPRPLRSAPGRTTRTDMAPRGVEARDTLPEERTLASRSNAYPRADVARNLASARVSLDRHSLWPAHRSIMNALAQQPDNGEAQRLRADLVSREQERDALLSSAHLCARERQWACVREDAGHAVAVDASSREARRLLARADADHRPRTLWQQFLTDWHGLTHGQTYSQANDVRSHDVYPWLHH